MAHASIKQWHILDWHSRGIDGARPHAIAALWPPGYRRETRQTWSRTTCLLITIDAPQFRRSPFMNRESASILTESPAFNEYSKYKIYELIKDIYSSIIYDRLS